MAMKLRNQTWVAIVVSVIAMVPAFFIGAIPATLYRLMMTSQIGPDPDVFFLRLFLELRRPV